MTNLLLPCPFCGGKAWFLGGESADDYDDYLECELCIRCEVCGSGTKRIHSRKSALSINKLKLLHIWNGRDTKETEAVSEQIADMEMKHYGIQRQST